MSNMLNSKSLLWLSGVAVAIFAAILLALFMPAHLARYT